MRRLVLATAVSAMAGAAGVLAQRARAEGLSFADAVKAGAMVEPPTGVPDMPPLLDALGALDADLFAIVEHDLYPVAPDVPGPIATRTRKYFNGCGLGPVPRRA